MMLYINGQDIARLVVGLLVISPDGAEWSYGPEAIACGPEGYLAAIDAALMAQKTSLNELLGIILVSGPGSPTALRASHAAVNALAFTAGITIRSFEKPPEIADAEILARLAELVPEPFAFPKYGSAPTITTSTRDALKRVI